jgi:hypothetical protein
LVVEKSDWSPVFTGVTVTPLSSVSLFLGLWTPEDDPSNPPAAAARLPLLKPTSIVGEAPAVAAVATCRRGVDWPDWLAGTEAPKAAGSGEVDTTPSAGAALGCLLGRREARILKGEDSALAAEAEGAATEEGEEEEEGSWLAAGVASAAEVAPAATPDASVSEGAPVGNDRVVGTTAAAAAAAAAAALVAADASVASVDPT